jgi:hypothetical protein
MPIPTQFDRTIGEIDAAAQSVIVTLSTMHRASEKDRTRMRLHLRQRLEDFCGMVMAAADDASN